MPGKRSITIREAAIRNTSQWNRPSLKHKQPGGLFIPYELLIILGLLSFLPVWRSGLKTNLTFWGFVLNHTTFGDPIEYIPRERYEEIFSEEEQV